MGFFKFYPFQIIWAKKMHGLVVLCGSVKGLSRDSQGTIKVALGVLWRFVGGLIWDPLFVR